MEIKVVFVVIDGVRALDFESETLFPGLRSLARSGIFLPNLRISNPVGVSLPAYADILAGRRQAHVLSNQRPTAGSCSPTLLNGIRTGLDLDADGVALISSWEAIGWLCEEGFYRRCGWEPGYLKPEIYPGSCADVDTVRVFLEEVPKRKPRFVFVHLGDADEEGHLHERGDIFHYQHALRASDHYVTRLKDFVDTHEYYRGSTYFVVTTDHGRDEPEWWDHGACVASGNPLCSGCRNVFGIVTGPGLGSRVVETPYLHTDWAPTVAALLGLSMPSALGQPMREVLPGH